MTNISDIRKLYVNNVVYQYVRNKFSIFLYSQEQKYYSKRLKKILDFIEIKDEIEKRIARKIQSVELNIIHYTHIKNGWEFFNLPDELKKIGAMHSIVAEDINVDNLNKVVSEVINYEKTNIFVTCLSSRHGVNSKFIQQLNEQNVITLFFNLDDDVKFSVRENGKFYGARAIASDVDLYLTSSKNSIKKYVVEGGRAIFSPEGANPKIFYPIELTSKYDVVFIGQIYGIREKLVEFLKKQGINIKVFGPNSGNIVPSFDEMNRIWNESKIVLGHGGIGYSNELRHLKGRDFEAIMSGACYVTTRLPELEEIFKEDEEMTFYDTFDECATKIKLLLSDEDRIKNIKNNVLKIREQHTWENRFSTVFKQLGIIESDESK